MKFVALPITLAAGLSLAGCTATPQGAATVQATPGSMSNVERYRRAVNIQAERKNVEVHWVNPPRDKDLEKYTDEDKDGR